MITCVWPILGFLLDQKISADQRPSNIAIKSAFHDFITGYEFKAVVEDRSPLRPKQYTIRKTSGGWPLLSKTIDALVLFANGFEDFIKPVGNFSSLCNMWRTVPKGKDYLATTVATIEDLYDTAAVD